MKLKYKFNLQTKKTKCRHINTEWQSYERHGRSDYLDYMYMVTVQKCLDCGEIINSHSSDNYDYF